MLSFSAIMGLHVHMGYMHPVNIGKSQMSYEWLYPTVINREIEKSGRGFQGLPAESELVGYLRDSCRP